MRYSALQENGYGVGLPQHRFPGDAAEARMAATYNVEAEQENKAEEGPLVSNLPLLFANGYPTSLEKITLAQLERFVTFMVQCSLGDETTDTITEPQWWPKEVKFSNPLTRPKKANENWMANLKKLVFRCYTYHRSEYLLRFCSFLARYPHEELEYVNNWDSTTSLYHKSTGKLMVTFRNENMNYDKKNESPRKKLLSHSGVATSYSNKSKQQQKRSLIMVEPPTEDIYLCDNCDAEFTGLEKMKEHERICCEQQEHPGNASSRSITPDALTGEPELKQNEFLHYFHLRSANTEPMLIEKKNGATVSNDVARRTSGRVRGSINFTRCATIPFSSPAGILLAKKSKAMTEETQQERLERIERHLIAPVLNDSSRPKWLDTEVERDRWIVTHKPSRDKPQDDYVHQYKFVNSVRIKPMLSLKSQLLYIVCRPVCVFLTRLSQEQINQVKRDSPKSRCPVRRMLVNKRTPSSGTKGMPRSNVSSKRKAPEDESDAPVTKIEELSTSAPSTGALPISNLVEPLGETSRLPDPASQPNQPNQPSQLNQPSQSSRSSDAITVIDLCSSDEEDLSNVNATADENRDPMNSNDSEITKSLLRKLSPGKLLAKPCNYPAVSKNDDWLTENIFDGSVENCTNKCRSNIMLNTCTQLSPILRPAP